MPVSLKLPPRGFPACPPRPRRWTVEEFHFIGDHGLFEGRRPILIDGAILEQGQMTPAFSCALGLAADAARAAFGSGWFLRQQCPLPLGPHTDPVPNVAVQRGHIRDYKCHATTAPLVVEIADAHNLSMNTTTKAELYAEAGVTDYWVIDVQHRELIVFRDPQLLASLGVTAYQSRQTFGPNDTVSPLAAPHATVRVADLLP